METNEVKTFRLPVLQMDTPLDIDGELAKFEAEQRKELGLEEGKEHWRDDNHQKFTAQQRAHTTLLISGLTMAHDLFLQGALGGIGYKVKAIDCPDNDALRLGKEFGNRGQCNPTYFTVGNLVKYLTFLRDEQGMSVKDIVENHIFLTAGACGPCRFGTYVTEYRKALRDAGFDGFRVMLFQQQGGLKQATGEAAGLEMNPKFFLAVIKAIMVGDVLNALGYRLRPYEVTPGAVNAALARCKEMVYEALATRKSLIPVLLRCRRELAAVKIDRTLPKPKVAIIGEFWAMTTEGDGNYQLQKFLEQEGAECDVQLVTAWILFMVWEQTWDTQQRMTLRGIDGGKKGLEGKNPWKKLLMLKAAEKIVRGLFQGTAWLTGLENYKLPDMQLIADVAKEHYNNHLRGGEAHMEVGKLILTTKHKKATMVVSVKPFGCMPSSGVSDGVQSIITEKYPGAIFCPIETNGDGAVNVYSRVQMMLFKARKAARDEVAKALSDVGMTAEQVKTEAAKHWSTKRTLAYPTHRETTHSADFVYEVASKSWKSRLKALAAMPKKLLSRDAGSAH